MSTAINRVLDNPSKADELAHWQEFLSTLPSYSYLSLYLQGSTDILRQAMADDMSCELLPAVRRRAAEALEQERAALAAKKKAQEELAEVQRQLSASRRDLGNVRDDLRKASEAATTLSRIAGESYQRAVGAVVDTLTRHR